MSFLFVCLFVLGFVFIPNKEMKSSIRGLFGGSLVTDSSKFRILPGSRGHNRKKSFALVDGGVVYVPHDEKLSIKA